MAGRPLGAVSKHKPARAALERFFDKAGKNPKALDDLAQALYFKAIKGDVMAMQLIFDRLDGKVPNTIGQSDEHGPISIVVTGVRQHSDIIDAQIEPEPKLINGSSDDPR